MPTTCLKNAGGGIAEIINVPATSTVDFETCATVMGEPGKAIDGTAVAKWPRPARIARNRPCSCRCWKAYDLSGCQGRAGAYHRRPGLAEAVESKLAMNTIRAYASPDAHVIYARPTTMTWVTKCV